MRIQIFIRIYKVRRFPLRLQIFLITSTEKTSIEQLSIELFHELLNHFSAIYFNTKDFYRIAPIERDYEDLFEFDMFTKSLNHFKGLRNLGSFLIYFLWNEFVCDFPFFFLLWMILTPWIIIYVFSSAFFQFQDTCCISIR